MTDIVERLRNAERTADLPFDQIDAERQEAADEIERLRGAVVAQGAEIDRVCKLALEYRDEIERLRAALFAIVECDDQYELTAYDHLHYNDEIRKVMDQARVATLQLRSAEAAERGG